MNVDFEIDIAATPEEVWPYLVEPELQQTWMIGVKRNELIEGDGHSVGSKFEMDIKEGGRIAKYDGTVTAYDRPSKLGVRLVGGCMKTAMTMDALYELTPSAGGGTRLRYSGGGELPGCFAKVMMIIFFWMPKMMVKKMMKGLKRAVESKATA